MGLRWLCVQRCYQPVFSADNPNLCMMYEQDTVYVFPESASEKVPRKYFDMIEDKPQAETFTEQEKPIEIIAPQGGVDIDQSPVSELCKMSDGIEAGLIAEGIATIGALREALTSINGERRLLESKNLAVGPSRLRKFKVALGLIKEEDDR